MVELSHMKKEFFEGGLYSVTPLKEVSKNSLIPVTQ
jgi:hypothetical protein